MNLNTKYIFIGTLCLFLILCSTCVFASDNTTCTDIDLNDAADQSLNQPVTDDSINMEKNTPDEKNSIKQLNETINHEDTSDSNISNTELKYQNRTTENTTINITAAEADANSNCKPVQIYNQTQYIFAGEEIAVEPIINSTMMNGQSSGILKDNITYSAVYDNNTHQFIIYITKEVAEGIVYEKICQFENITNTSEIYAMIENKQYTPVITMTRNYDINSQEDYINTMNSNVYTLFQAIEGNIVNEEIANERTRCEEANIQCTFNRCLNVNFKKTLDFECSSTWTFSDGIDIININGNASRIYSKFDDSEEYVFANLYSGKILTVSNLTIAGFNHGIINHAGTCIFNNVTFDNNKMDYWIAKDYGAGIYNDGLCICNNCTFSNNYCKYGAGIYNAGTLYLNNNTFIANCAYKEGSNVAVDGGTVYVDGEKIEENTPEITHISPFNYDTVLECVMVVSSLVMVAGFILLGFGPTFLIPAIVCIVPGVSICAAASIILTYRNHSI